MGAVATREVVVDRDAERWVTTWATAVFPNSPAPSFGDEGFANQTIRMELPLSIGGSRFRLRLTNRCGTRPLTFAAVTVGPSGGPFTDVGFGGRTEVRLPTGGEVLSDAVDVVVEDLETIAVSLFASEPTGPPTRSQWFMSADLQGAPAELVAPGSGYVNAGDLTHAPTKSFAPAPFQGFLASVEVLAPATVPAVVAIGDSLTMWYPSSLARAAIEVGQRIAVANVGINGNRLLSSSPCFGEAGLTRFASDVLLQTGVETVIAMWFNDIGMTQFEVPTDLSAFMPPPECFRGADVTADDLITGWRLLLARGHAAGIRVLGGTTPPFKGSIFYNTPNERVRRELNDWIRSGGEFDGVVDFDAALRDEVDIEQVAPQFHLGDFLHPTFAGARAMADVVDLNALRSPTA